MNLLVEVEGTKGEVLTSAVLRFLILKSPELRNAFLGLLSAKSPCGPVTSTSHFACYSEETTTDLKGQRGRIDLFVETDSCVIGIENKLFAKFGEEQPAKYVAAIARRAQEYGRVKSRKHDGLFAVIAPTSRSAEVSNLLRDLEMPHVLVEWERIRDSFAGLAACLNNEMRATVGIFVEYLNQNITFYPDFRNHCPHFKRQMPPGGSEIQRKLVGKIWQFMPGPGPRLSHGDTWIGYYFAAGKEFAEKTGWYGFVPSHGDPLQDHSGDDEMQAELVFATNFSVEGLSGAFKPVRIRSTFLENKPRQIYAWTLDIDPAWDNPTSWETELRPFVAAASQ